MLSNYRVLDLSDERGHLAGRILADLGADVIKIAPPTGDPLRQRAPYPGPEARRQALALVRALDAAEQAVAQGERGRDALLSGVHAEIGQASLAQIDYAEIRDPETLEISPGQLAGPSLLALAVNFAPDGPGQGAPVRLIDNRVLTPGPAA